MTSDSPRMISIKDLTPHRDNPRLIEREDVIAAIEQQLRDQAFDLSHAITARTLNGHFEIVSGHQRVSAAKRAGLKQVPTWVREMDARRSGRPCSWPRFAHGNCQRWRQGGTVASA